MRRWIVLLSSALLATGLAVSSPAAPGAQKGKPAKKMTAQEQKRRADLAFQRIQEALEKLSLTPDQKQRVQKVVQETKAEGEKLRASGGDFKSKRPRYQELMKGFRGKLLAILTPEQKKKLQEMWQKRQREAGKQRKGKKLITG